MSQISITIDETTVRQLVFKYLQEQLGEIRVDEKKVVIEVKSKQNFRSEWENAAFRASYSATI